MRTLPMLACLLVVALAASYCQAQSRFDRKMDGASNYNSERFTDLPTGEHKLYMTVATSDGWQSNARERQVLNWLASDPRLARTWDGCHKNWYLASNPHFRDQLKHNLGEAYPIVALQRPNGEVLMKVSATTMPRSAGELADMVDNALHRHYAPPDASAYGQGATIITDECPDGNCEPAVPDTNPFAHPSRVVPDVVPRSPVQSALLVVAVVAGLLVLFGLILFAGRQRAAVRRSLL